MANQTDGMLLFRHRPRSVVGALNYYQWLTPPHLPTSLTGTLVIPTNVPFLTLLMLKQTAVHRPTNLRRYRQQEHRVFAVFR